MTHRLTQAMDSLRTRRDHFRASCYKITRTDGVVIRLTDADAKITLADGQVYHPSGGASASSRRKQIDIDDQDIEVLGVMDSSFLTYEDLASRKYTDATVDMFLVDRRYPFAGHYQHQHYWMRPAKYDRDRWSIDADGFGGVISQPVGSIASKTCGHELGAEFETGRVGCSVDLSLFTIYAKTVTLVDSTYPSAIFQIDYVLAVEFDGQFNLGKVNWLTGDNTGKTSRVRRSLEDSGTGNQQLELLNETMKTVQVGDTCELVRGCNKIAGVLETDSEVGDCRNVYSNVPEFGGDPYIPGSGKIYRRIL
jgi:uncharacterized phage protein (TIGR02218 family)